MAVEHLRAVMGMNLSKRTVIGRDGSRRSVSAAVRKTVLMSMVWEIRKGEDYAYKAVTTVVRETQLSRRQVQTAIRSLEAEGILVATSIVHGTEWRGLSNAYVVKLPLERHGDTQAIAGLSGLVAPTAADSRPAATESPAPASDSPAPWVAQGPPIGSMGLHWDIDGLSQEQKPKEPCASHAWVQVGSDSWLCHQCRSRGSQRAQ